MCAVTVRVCGEWASCGLQNNAVSQACYQRRQYGYNKAGECSRNERPPAERYILAGVRWSPLAYNGNAGTLLYVQHGPTAQHVSGVRGGNKCVAVCVRWLVVHVR